VCRRVKRKVFAGIVLHFQLFKIKHFLLLYPPQEAKADNGRYAQQLREYNIQSVALQYKICYHLYQPFCIDLLKLLIYICIVLLINQVQTGKVAI